jgi:transposase
VDAGEGGHADRPAVPVRYTLRGVSYLLHRLGYAPQVPAHRAVERDEKAIAAWRTQAWVKLRG